MLLPGSHRALTGRVSSLVSSSVSQTFKPRDISRFPTSRFASAYLGQVSQLVGIEQQFLQTPLVAVNLIGHVQQRAVAFIDHLHMTVAPPQGYTVKHHGGGADEAPRNRGQDTDATDCSDGTVSGGTSRCKRGRGCNSRPPELRKEARLGGAPGETAAMSPQTWKLFARICPTLAG